MGSIAEMIKASFTSKDACVEPHGWAYASRLLNSATLNYHKAFKLPT